MELTDARTGTNEQKILAKSPIKGKITNMDNGSMYDLGESDDDDDLDADELTRFVFKFRHTTN
jgi:hypothetical protein